MGETKGISLVSVRKEITNQGQDTLHRFIEALPEDLKTVFTGTFANEWIPLEKLSRTVDMAAKTLYPGDGQGLQRVGRIIALDHLRGVYKIFLRVVSVSFLMEQSAKLWRTYHSSGNARADNTNPGKQLQFIVSDYPDMPAAFRKSMCGYIAASVELTNAKNILVRHDDSSPLVWRWHVTWE